MLPTATPTGHQGIQSPIPASADSPRWSQVREALRAGVGLADLTGIRLFRARTQGPPLKFAQGLGLPDPQKGQVTEAAGLWAARLTDDEHLLLMTEAQETPIESLEAEPRASLVSVTEVTHGVATILLAGPRTPELLRKACGLDLSDEARPDQSVAETSVAKVHAALLRRDWRGARAYIVIVDRSVGRYAWEALRTAGREFHAVTFDGDSYPSGEWDIE